MSEVTLLLKRMAEGDKGAGDKLLPLIYDELRRRAAHCMSNERANHTLQGTALVHEVYLKLFADEAVRFESKAHFFNAAAEAMRRILVDHYRSHGADKRGGNRKQVDLSEAEVSGDIAEQFDYEKLDLAMNRLKELDKRRYQVVMLRYFAGLTEQEIATDLNVTTKTVQRDWNTAKVFLRGEMRE